MSTQTIICVTNVVFGQPEWEVIEDHSEGRLWQKEGRACQRDSLTPPATKEEEAAGEAIRNGVLWRYRACATMQAGWQKSVADALRRLEARPGDYFSVRDEYLDDQQWSISLTATSGCSRCRNTPVDDLTDTTEAQLRRKLSFYEDALSQMTAERDHWESCAQLQKGQVHNLTNTVRRLYEELARG